MPTKKSKKTDQLYISRAEIRKNRQVSRLEGIVRDCNKFVRAEGNNQFGRQWVKRLQNSASRAGRSMVGYLADVLLKP